MQYSALIKPKIHPEINMAKMSHGLLFGPSKLDTKKINALYCGKYGGLANERKCSDKPDTLFDKNYNENEIENVPNEIQLPDNEIQSLENDFKGVPNADKNIDYEIANTKIKSDKNDKSDSVDNSDYTIIKIYFFLMGLWAIFSGY